jgi:hypothetical protein
MRIEKPKGDHSKVELMNKGFLLRIVQVRLFVFQLGSQ